MSRRLISTIDIEDVDINEEIELVIPDGVTTVTPDAVDLTHIDRLTICPRCRKPLVPSKAMSGTESTFFLECPACGTLINTFLPSVPKMPPGVRKTSHFSITSSEKS